MATTIKFIKKAHNSVYIKTKFLYLRTRIDFFASASSSRGAHRQKAIQKSGFFLSGLVVQRIE